MSKKTDEFIAAIAPIAQAEYTNRARWVLPSVCIAQAALESGWNANAKTLFGIKGSGASLKTTEYINGKWENITAAFKAYPDIASAVHEYYDLITTAPRYSKAVNNGDPAKTIDAIAAAGYATDPDYARKVKSIITRYKLHTYDAKIITAGNYTARHYTVSADALRVRDAASTRGRIVGLWRRGTQFDAVEVRQTGGAVWLRSIYGWVCATDGKDVFVK